MLEQFLTVTLSWSRLGVNPYLESQQVVVHISNKNNKLDRLTNKQSICKYRLIGCRLYVMREILGL